MTRIRDERGLTLADEAPTERVIDTHEKITISARDWEVFYDALIYPSKPNRKLTEAARRYRERVGG